MKLYNNNNNRHNQNCFTRSTRGDMTDLLLQSQCLASSSRSSPSTPVVKLYSFPQAPGPPSSEIRIRRHSLLLLCYNGIQPVVSAYSESYFMLCWTFQFLDFRFPCVHVSLHVSSTVSQLTQFIWKCKKALLSKHISVLVIYLINK